ncbi:MAG: hypothetical protein MJ081_04325, partial [Ruminococcus sp.]|nr:hypothetical protein [Ruminococcus sp.]
GSGDTTTSTIPEGAVTTTAVKSVYVELEKQPGFYLNVEDSFDANQIKSAYLNIVYAWGYDLEDGTHIDYKEFKTVKDITSSVGFGTATPESTYKPENTSFVYDVDVVYNGEDILDDNGKQILTKGNLLLDAERNVATVEVYIGVKGDANLDNVVDGTDASDVLTYYAKTSVNDNDATNTILSGSELAVTPSSIYDSFAAFLSDVNIDLDSKDKFSRFAEKADRLMDATDASSILTFYAKGSTTEYEELSKNDPSKLWDIVLG